MVKNLVVLGIAQIIVAVLGLVSNAIWARYTTLEQFGSIQLVLSFLAIATSLSFPGLKYSAEISAAQNKDGNFIRLIQQKLKYSFIGYLILIFLAALQLVHENYEITYLVLITILLFNPIILMECCVGWLNGLNRVKTLASIEVATKTLSVLVISIILFLHINITLVMFMFLLSQSLCVAFTLKLCLSLRQNCDEDVNLLSYGKAMSWPMLIASLISFDKFIISEYLSLEDLAIYSVAIIFANYPKQLHKMFARILVPKISAEQNLLQVWNNIKKLIVYFTIISLSFGMIGFIAVDNLVYIIFTNKFAEATELARWFWLMGCLSIPMTFLADILRAQQIINFTRIFEPCNSIIRLLLLIILIPLYGLWGAFLSIFILQIAASAFFLIYFMKELKVTQINAK